MFLEEKIEGRKVQFLPFLLSKNMRKYTLKNTGFCPNKVIHFKMRIHQVIILLLYTGVLLPVALIQEYIIIMIVQIQIRQILLRQVAEQVLSIVFIWFSPIPLNH